MVWLDVMGDNGSALYFVTDRVERLQGRGAPGMAVSGLVGDGQYEGQVLIEVGSEVQVTFVDAWIATREFHRFVQRVDLIRVTAALSDAAAGMAGSIHGRGSMGLIDRSGRNGRIAAGRVAEALAAWREVA
ncbi:MAG: hypothetical protein A2X84_03610 [Desulfuromonadaceae bacterium GWC2_58_13]|nr:MAG: hypothetical protein A2X84_03610 [Desulfuromonadaceae bacterium GWC2_58_13]